MTFASAQEPRWLDPERSRLGLRVEYDEHGLRDVVIEQEATDSVPCGPELFERAMAGEFGEVAPPAVPVEADERSERIARARAAAGKATGNTKAAMLAIIDAIEAPPA